jgi:hypothetical protein
MLQLRGNEPILGLNREELMEIKAWLELSFLGFWSSGFFFLAPSGM